MQQVGSKPAWVDLRELKRLSSIKWENRDWVINFREIQSKTLEVRRIVASNGFVLKYSLQSERWPSLRTCWLEFSTIRTSATTATPTRRSTPSWTCSDTKICAPKLGTFQRFDNFSQSLQKLVLWWFGRPVAFEARGHEPELSRPYDGWKTSDFVYVLGERYLMHTIQIFFDQWSAPWTVSGSYLAFHPQYINTRENGE